MSSLIIDLGYIMVVAGIVTILFKWLRQPLVLGYIVAGFIAGPHMDLMPTVSSIEGIKDWSDIGVIFLMFTLGLEFSFKRIVSMGMKPILTAMMVMGCMIGIGGLTGKMFGWSSMDCLFLGGMLSMSSTTIIYKAYDDMGLRSKPFAGNVMSVLILEDILGILLMVMLSAMAVSRQFQGMELLGSLMELGFFLLLWFMVGIYVVPLLLRKARRYISQETLLIVSVGLCFLMAIIASKVGYSPAFGAFMMGSILAETLEAETIEKTVGSLRDLFGAVFFVSVGMMVEPSVLVAYWLPVLVLTLAVVMGQMLFGSLSYFIGGSSLSSSIQSGFSMVQIGEFAFIIANLGTTLGVTSGFLYPIVVAVSIITTFLTPYVIRMAPGVSRLIEKKMPAELQPFVSRRSMEQKEEAASASAYSASLTVPIALRRFGTAVVYQTVAYVTICIAMVVFSMGAVLPLFTHLLGADAGTIICMLVTLVCISPCVRPIIIRKNRSREAAFLRSSGFVGNSLALLIIAAKVLVGYIIIYNVVGYMSELWWLWRVMISVAALVVMSISRPIKYVSIRMERTFMQNLRQRENKGSMGYGRKLRGKDLQIERITVPSASLWGGKTLAQLRFGSTEHINIVAIIRAGQRINIPGGNNKVYPGDKLEVVAGKSAIAALRARAEQELCSAQKENDALRRELAIISLTLSEQSPLVGLTLHAADFRLRYHCMVVGMEDAEGHLQVPDARRTLSVGDKMWIVGEQSDLSLLGMTV